MTPKEKFELIDRATKEFSGQLPELEKAIGAFMVGELVGWRVLYMVHDRRTIKKYEQILEGVDFRKVFQERGKYSHKSLGLKIADKLGNFWQMVRGEASRKQALKFE